MLPYPSLVLVRPRKTGPCLTERLLMGRKESNQTNKNILLPCVLYCIRFKITSVCVTGQEKIVSLSSCRTSAILKYFCPLVSILHVFAVVLELAIIFQNFTDQPWVCKYHAQHVQLVPFHSGYVRNVFFLVLGYLRNEFDFWNVPGIMNTSGLLQSK